MIKSCDLFTFCINVTNNQIVGKLHIFEILVTKRKHWYAFQFNLYLLFSGHLLNLNLLKCPGLRTDTHV